MVMDANFRLVVRFPRIRVIGEPEKNNDLHKLIYEIQERGRKGRPIRLSELLGCDPLVLVDGGGTDVSSTVIEMEIEGYMRSLNEGGEGAMP